MFEVTQRDVTDDGAMTVNLAMYGWATRFIFADQQSTAQRLRATAKRSPARVPRPRPYHHHVLIDREEGDNSLADSHRRAGRTPYVRYDGVDHDYVILRDDKELAREALRAMAISKTRAERRNGTTALQSDNMMISPLEITRRHRET